MNGVWAIGPASAAPVHQPHSSGWSARLEIGLELVAGRSAVVRKRHHGPLGVQRAFYPEPDGVAHVYLLHPPGGIVHGDELHLDVNVGAGARALITTPAATKFYRSAGRTAQQTQVLRVRDGATLEWLPQETIVYGEARVRTETRVELEPGGTFCGWDIVCLGRAASGDHFASGRLEQAFEIWQGERPLWIERSCFGATEPVRGAAWGLGGHSVFGTCVCTGRNPAAVAAVRAAVGPAISGEFFSVSQTREAIVCRYLGDSTE
jgi:urease accessory protein